MFGKLSSIGNSKACERTRRAGPSRKSRAPATGAVDGAGAAGRAGALAHPVSAANAYKKGGFQFPEEQPVQLALLEHSDEAEVCSALDVLTALLDEQAPIKLPVFEQRLKRLEDGAENPETRRRAAELRRVLRT